MATRTMRVSPVSAPVREQLLANLRAGIFDRTFAPGQRLIERELCELTGVSRTSIREALRQLEAEGLVKIIPNRGPVVARISADEAAQLYEVRAALEALAVQLFTERATDDQINELEATVDHIERTTGGSAVDLLAAKDEFYRVLFAGAGNDVMVRLLESLRARVTHLRATSLHREGRSAETVAELRTIIDAIRRRDPAAAGSATTHHIEQAAAVARTVLAEEPAAP